MLTGHAVTYRKQPKQLEFPPGASWSVVFVLGHCTARDGHVSQVLREGDNEDHSPAIPKVMLSDISMYICAVVYTNMSFQKGNFDKTLYKERFICVCIWYICTTCGSDAITNTFLKQIK